MHPLLYVSLLYNLNRSTGWNDKIAVLEKTTWFHFRVMKNRFFFVVVADHLLVGQLCTNPQSERSLLSCLKLTQCSTSEIHLTTSEGHLTSSKSAWKPTSKCTWMCWRVWWSPGAIRWPVADPGYGSRTRSRPTSPKRPRLGFRRSATTLYPSLTGPPPPLTWTRGTTSFGHTSRTSPTWPPTTPKPARSPPSDEYSPSSPPALVEKACSQFRIRIEAVIEAEGGYIE